MTASEGARNDNLLLSLRGIPPSVIARSASDEAISKRDSSLSLGTRIATPSARNDNLVTGFGFRYQDLFRV